MTLAEPICLLINGKMKTMQIKVKFNGYSELWVEKLAATVKPGDKQKMGLL